MVSMNSNFDEDGPLVKEDTPTKKGEQSVLMKEAIVSYFIEREVIYLGYESLNCKILNFKPETIFVNLHTSIIR
jgi:hypothetical protein